MVDTFKQIATAGPGGSPPTSPTPLSHPAAPRPGKRHNREGWRSIFSTIAVLLIAPLFALFLITFVFQSYLVDGPSMEPTLQDRDRLLVWKVPRTWARITGNSYIPDRGDIVVFTEPKLEDYGQSSGKQLIKRVIALPGERVTIEDGLLMVYNDEHPDGFQPDTNLPSGTIVGVTPGELDMAVPEDHIFVAGDNRSNSLDSRSFGPVSANNIVGKLSARFLPFDQMQRF